jgi:hypothetical protein
MIILILLAAGAAIWALDVTVYHRLLLLYGYGCGVAVAFVGMYCVAFERDRTVRRLRRQLREHEEAHHG